MVCRSTAPRSLSLSTLYYSGVRYSSSALFTCSFIYPHSYVGLVSLCVKLSVPRSCCMHASAAATCFLFLLCVEAVFSTHSLSQLYCRQLSCILVPISRQLDGWIEQVRPMHLPVTLLCIHPHFFLSNTRNNSMSLIHPATLSLTLENRHIHDKITAAVQLELKIL